MINNYGEISIKLDGICLRQGSMSFIHINVVKLYIIYELDIWSRELNADLALASCLLGPVKFDIN